MTNLFDALEFCLRETEGGGDIETALARFPEYADELRPILKTALKARGMASAEPAPEIVRRSRARVLNHAAELRESQIAPRRRSIPAFQRLAIAFALTAVFLLSGSGLLSASASALPGEGLYPVKRGWENLRLFFIFDSEARDLLENEFENERLHEVNELLSEGRHEVIEFAGVFMQVNGIAHVSGLRVILQDALQAPANGAAVIVRGRTNAQGYVEIISLELLPEGSLVPAGFPIEVETESGEETDPETGPNSGSAEEPAGSESNEFDITGILQAVSTTELVVNGLTLYLDNSKVAGQLCVGMDVEVKGYHAADGRFIVREVKGRGECAGDSSGNSNSNTNSDAGNENGSSGSNQNSGDDDNSNSGDDSNANDSDDDDDNSGSGGGDDDD